MTDELERLVAEIPDELKALVDADSRSNREATEAALWREYGGERQGALERRIEEKRARIEVVKEEIEYRQQELESEQQELEKLEAKLEAQQESEAAYEAAVAEVAETFATSQQVLPSFRGDVQAISEEHGVPLEDVEADIREWVAQSDHEVDDSRYTDTYGDGL